MADDRHVAKLADLVDVANIADPVVASDAHPPARALKVAAGHRFDQVLSRLRRVDAPVQAVLPVLDLQRAGMSADRNASVIDGRDETVEARVAQRPRLDHFAEAAEVAALDAVRDA